MNINHHIYQHQPQKVNKINSSMVKLKVTISPHGHRRCPPPPGGGRQLQFNHPPWTPSLLKTLSNPSVVNITLSHIQPTVDLCCIKINLVTLQIYRALPPPPFSLILYLSKLYCFGSLFLLLISSYFTQSERKN